MASKTGNIVQGFYNKNPFPDYELDRFSSKTGLASLLIRLLIFWIGA